ncbi:MAG: type II secretion system protein M, partial [Gammaproteobacteria bacterium]|nr:type II secretion system protein M [Gammaproteobacteria bacterium]
MQDLKRRFDNFYSKLPKREQIMLIAISGLLVFTVLYLLIWEPIFDSLNQQSEKLQSQKKIFLWMQNAEQEVNTIRASGSFVSPQKAGQSINSLVERSAISAGIRSSISKMDSASQKNLKVQLKSVEFDRL